PEPPPPSRYETFAALDNELTGNKAQNPVESYAPPPPIVIEPEREGSDPQKNNYLCDVFEMASRVTNLWRNQEILPNLEAQSYQAGNGTIIIHDIGRAQELNLQHRAEHISEDANRYWEAPHQESRLVVDYIPNVEKPTYERLYSPTFIDGDKTHPQVFVAPVGSLSIDQLENNMRDYQIASRSINKAIATVTLKNPDAVVTRSIVARSSKGSIQYLVYRSDATFAPKEP
ncbi:MAG: hypothetical protein WAO98_07880, partial [Alphaproteobacteria bacterium]